VIRYLANTSCCGYLIVFFDSGYYGNAQVRYLSSARSRPGTTMTSGGLQHLVYMPNMFLYRSQQLHVAQRQKNMHKITYMARHEMHVWRPCFSYQLHMSNDPLHDNDILPSNRGYNFNSYVCFVDPIYMCMCLLHLNKFSTWQIQASIRSSGGQTHHSPTIPASPQSCHLRTPNRR
jgi:hypothetical protein